MTSNTPFDTTAAAGPNAPTRAALRDLLRAAIDATGVASPRLDFLIDDYYLPLLDWCQIQLRGLAADASAPPRAFFLGINGPQGGGKSTLVRLLTPLFERCGLRTIALSIDDFYLTNAAQRLVAAGHPHDRYLQQRGFAGTHDVALGTRILAALASVGADVELALPIYDKGRHDGAGDRVESLLWPRVHGPIDLVLLEGWMLGFAPVPPVPLPAELRAANARLAPYAAWTRRLDAMIQLRMASDEFVVDWRIDAEAARQRRGCSGMTPAAVRAYIATFLPLYRVYPEALERAPPTPKRHLVVWLGRDRLPRRSLSSVTAPAE